MQNSAIGLPSYNMKLICSTFPCRLGKQNGYQLNLLNTTLYYNTLREKIKKDNIFEWVPHFFLAATFWHTG